MMGWFEEALAAAPKDPSERLEAAINSVLYTPNKEETGGGLEIFLLRSIKSLEKKRIINTTR